MGATGKHSYDGLSYSSPTSIGGSDSASSFIGSTTGVGPSLSKISGDTSFGSSLDRVLNTLVSTSGSPFADSVRENMQVINGNSALSQSYAQTQMDFQRDSSNYAMDWSASQAATTRDWQERLSNTSHQREVSDLMAAGLNPILSANGGASTPTGATGQAYTNSGAMGAVDTSFTQMFNGVINAALQLRGLDQSAELAREQMQNNAIITAMNNDASVRSAGISAGAVMQAALTNKESAQYGYDTQYKYNTEKLAQDMIIANAGGNTELGALYRIMSSVGADSADLLSGLLRGNAPERGATGIKNAAGAAWDLGKSIASLLKR